MGQDVRDYQITFLGLFLGLGLATRDWTLRLDGVAIAIATSLLTQVGFSWGQATLKSFVGASGPAAERGLAPLDRLPLKLSLPEWNWRSPLITALGLSLLLRTQHGSTMALAAFLAIASKFVFQINGKHCFNPANAGIIAALTLTQDAWVSPGQWGEEVWYALIFLGAGGIVLKRVGRWDTTATFLGSYAMLEALRNLYLGWAWDVWLHRLMSGSLLLFALFMVTDPRSIPDARPARLLWATSIAGLTFVLRNSFYVPTAVFWALFLLSPLTLVLDRLWPAPRFTWRPRSQPSSEAICP